MLDSIIARNNVKVSGFGGQPMMFAHGFGCDQNMWRFITPAFEEDYRVIVFDYVGHGQSDPQAYNAERYANLYGYAEDILEIIEALDLNDVILVGHSVSSMIAALAAIKAPQRFHSLVFVGPSPRYVNDPPDYVGGFERKDIEDLLDTMERNYIGWANFLAPAIMKNPGQPELAGELTESFCSTDPIVARQFAEATFLSDNRRDLPSVPVPSLIMQCSEDIIAPLDVGHYMEKHTPQSTLRIMKATGHCPHMSAPEETIELMKNFLGQLEPA